MLPKKTPSELRLRMEYPELVLDMENIALEKELNDDLGWPASFKRTNKSASISLPLGEGYRMQLTPVNKGNSGFYTWMSWTPTTTVRVMDSSSQEMNHLIGTIHASISITTTQRNNKAMGEPLKFTLSDLTLEDLVIEAVCLAEEYLGFELCPPFLEPNDHDSTDELLKKYFSDAEVLVLRNPLSTKEDKRAILARRFSPSEIALFEEAFDEESEDES
jgi:hypothetical protein